MTKEETRSIEKEYGLVNANKKDSFDVCFIKTTFTDYITANLKQEKGKVIDIDTQEVIGTHNGLGYYTIGQRRGLNIGGTDERMFVVGKDIKNNILYTCIGEDNEYLYSDSCIINNYNSLSNNNITKCTAKFRYRQKDVEVELEYLDNAKVLVKFKDKQKRITPGQACVFYDNEQCLGGGIIEEVRLNNKKIWYV